MSNRESRVALIERANTLLNKKPFTKEDKAQFDGLMKLADVLETVPEATGDEKRKAEREAFRKYLAHGENAETRTYASLTEDNSGAFVVPADFRKQLLQGIAQYTELLDENNVSLIQTETGRTLTIPSIDLSTITAAIVAQGVDAPPVANPTISSMVLKGFSYRTNPIASTFELEQDSFEAIQSILTAAFSVALARGIGSDLVNGSGSGAPLGILAAASNSNITAASSTAFTRDELESIYFSVNRAYRVSPKCAWLMNDTTYQNVLSLKDTAGRPLVNTADDGERIYGKRILISPDMPVSAGSKAICFGDFGQFQVRVAKSGVLVRRNVQAPGYAEQGAALYTAHMRVDSALNAPGSTAPVVYGTLHS